jgi:Fic family protein
MATRLLEQLPRHPMLTIPTAVKLLEASKPTATKAIGVLEQLGILREATGRRRDRTFSYTGYLELLRKGTDEDG